MLAPDLRQRSIVWAAAALCAVLFTAPAATAQGAASPAAAPAAQPATDPDRWEATIKKFEDEDRAQPLPRNEIVFVGSSSIVRWDLKKDFPELGAKAINRGFGGSLLSDSVRYVDRIVIPYKPRIVVLYAGDNDIGGGASAERILSLFKQFDEKVHTALPETKIVFISIKPSIRRWAMQDAIHAANNLVREYAATRPHVTFLDIERDMLGPDGKPNPALLVSDGLHMTPAGYAIWNAKLRPHLK
jgi:lysophospholipase L1-like esterase